MLHIFLKLIPNQIYQNTLGEIPQDKERKILAKFFVDTARKFGKAYRQSDINFMIKNLPKNSTITLDYSAYKMTKFQSAQDLYVYVDDVEKTAQFLKKIILEKEQKEILYCSQKQDHLKI